MLCKNVKLALADDGIVKLNINVGASDLVIISEEGQEEMTVIAAVFGEDDYVPSLEKEGEKKWVKRYKFPNSITTPKTIKEST